MCKCQETLSKMILKQTNKKKTKKPDSTYNMLRLRYCIMKHILHNFLICVSSFYFVS